MDGLVGLFLVVAAGVLAAPVMAIIALVRVSRLQRRQPEIERLEQRLTSTEAALKVTRRQLAELVERIGGAPASPTAEPARDPRPDTALPVAEPPPAPTPRSSEIASPDESPPPAAVSQPETATPAAEPRPAPARAPEAAAPTEAPPASPRPPQPPSGLPPRPAVDIDWERWIGIRGAAVLGAVALGLAGLLFFKYSIEQGLITPAMRVVLGTLTGLGCIVGSEWLRTRRYEQTAEGVAGAGIVILYAAFWAAHTLYSLIPMAVAFGLMVLVTVTCCLLAVRRESMVVAVLGLIGGFATPLLLSSGSDRPIGLFGYVLLLDLGLLAVGHKRRWPSLGVLSLLGTVLLQALWIGERMGPERLFLGLAILVVFGALFVFAAPREKDPKLGGIWRMTQLGGIVFPFAFALYFASRVELGAHLWPIALLLALLSAAACWLAQQQQVYPIGVGAAAASVAVVGIWRMQHTPSTPALAWELVAVAVGLSALFHFFVEREQKTSDVDGPAPAALIAAGGFFALLLSVVPAGQVSIWPWVLGWGLLAALACRHATFPDRAWLQPLAAVGIGVGLTSLHLFPAPFLPPAWQFLALLVVAPLAFHALALLQREDDTQNLSGVAAMALPLVLLSGLAVTGYTSNLSPIPALGTVSLLGALAVLAATRSGNGVVYIGAVVATLAAHVGWIDGRAGLTTSPQQAQAALFLGLATVALFTLWPLLVTARFSTGRNAWYGAALAGPLFFLPLRYLFELRFGDDFVGVLPVVLGALSLGAAARARTALRDDGVRMTALVWLAAVALCFLAVAIPLQLEKEWVTLGWALQGLAVLALWKRLDHPGLKYFGLALLGASAVRLVANPAILTYYPRGSVRIFNWLLYTYLVPAAAMLGSARILAALELPRARPREQGLYAAGHSLGSIAAGLAAIAVTFVWINLAIADWFATGATLTLSFGDAPPQRLTVSIAWALYALLLLGIGMARNSLGLRWLSLGFLLFTIGKVFLYDLGALEDLYRVASLVGLAASLILVSLLYQRFVFRSEASERS